LGSSSIAARRPVFSALARVVVMAVIVALRPR
jgi:hypothetical protein